MEKRARRMFFHKVKLVNRLITLFLLCVLPITARAQRTTCGGGMVSLEGFYPLGGGLSYGQYLPSSLWEVGVNGLWRDYAINDEHKMQYLPVCAYGNWMYRIAATRTRSFNLYAGMGAFLGWEFYDPGKTLPESISEELSKGTFLYGINPKIQMQIFPSKRFSVLLSGIAPINFSSPCSWIQPCVSLGLRLDL